MQSAPALPQNNWPEQIPEPEWRLYRSAIDAVRGAGGRFLMGGAFGLAAHTGRWRNTKDLDLYVLPDERRAVIDTLGRAGFEDYYSVRPYDRNWIHRSTRDGVIVDVIWAMANQRAQVDELWFARSLPVPVRDVVLSAVPAEELIWAKLYIIQRERCDWPDVMNLFEAVGPRLDWEHLLRRLNDDVPLLAAAMAAFGWLSPLRAAEMAPPPALQCGIPDAPPPAESDGAVLRRAAFLDTRPWFSPSVSE